jgi:uncharacterized protein (TIGR02266 family)
VTATASEHARTKAASAASRADARAVASAAKARRKGRAHHRVAVRCGCWLEHEQATVFGTTVDLGRGGLFLRTALPMPPGVDVRVTLRLPGSETVVADGKVVRMVAPTGGDRPGLGVRFERLPDGEDSLCAFLFGNLESGSELTDAALEGNGASGS